MPGTSSPTSVSTKLQKIAKLARDAPDMVLTSLAHHIDVVFLTEAYRRTRKDGAVGVDGQTATDYAAKLEENLQRLLDRFKSGQYRAPAVRRVHIPKGDGHKTRPIGIPTFEDKVLQRAVVMVLDAVYEQDFLDCSYTASDQDDRPTWRSRRCGKGRWTWEAAGCWSWTLSPSSTTWTTPIYGRFSTSGCATE